MSAPVVLQVGSRSARTLPTREFAATRMARITYCEDEDCWSGLPRDLGRKLRGELQAREPWLLSLGLKERVAYAGLLGAAALIRAGFTRSVLILPLDWVSGPEHEPTGIGEGVPLEAGLAFAVIPDLAPLERQALPAMSCAARTIMDGPVACVSDPDAAGAFVDAVESSVRSRSGTECRLEEVLIDWVLQGRIRPFRQQVAISGENAAAWLEATPPQIARAFVQAETPLRPFVFLRDQARLASFVWQAPDFSRPGGPRAQLCARLRAAYREKFGVYDPGRGSADPISGVEQVMLRQYLAKANANPGQDWKKEFVRWMLAAEDSAGGPSRIESEIYRHRPDMQAAFGRQSGALGEWLRAWFVRHGLAELGISLIAQGDLEITHRRRRRALPGNEEAALARDVHVVGYMDSVLGLGVSARNLRAALELTGVSVASTAMPLPSEPDAAPPPKPALKCPVSLLVVNGDHLRDVSARLDGESLRNSHRVGVWAWELPLASPRMLDGLAYIDELWVPSSFVRDAFRPYTRKAIAIVPNPVWAGTPDASGCDDVLPGKPYLFFAFDYHSSHERKNPSGLIAAFMSAFPEGTGPQLLVKTLNASSYPEYHERLLDVALRRKDIRIVDGIWRRGLLERVLRNSMGVVSLHRAEGFGLLLAEAMSHGRPTIATGYSGNLEFQHPGNSLLVGYRMTKVPADCPQYEAGGAWAEPDIDEAARAMRAVFKGGRDIEELARAGQQTVRERLAPEVVGRRMKALLQAHLGHSGGPAWLLRQWRRLGRS